MLPQVFENREISNNYVLARFTHLFIFSLIDVPTYLSMWHSQLLHIHLALQRTSDVQLCSLQEYMLTLELRETSNNKINFKIMNLLVLLTTCVCLKIKYFMIIIASCKIFGDLTWRKIIWHSASKLFAVANC